MLSDTDQERVQNLTKPYRREIQLHCYRLLGSLHDAEGLVQETFLRAWRALDSFEGRTSCAIGSTESRPTYASTPAARMPAECCRRRACGIQLLTLQDHAIASRTNFVDVRLFTAFDLPQVLPAQDVPLRSATAALSRLNKTPGS